jgi:demethylmenaquinone methyltransferase/2-methoxy-6-polyprenyl-1,4-benzoquinol methylase
MPKPAQDRRSIRAMFGDIAAHYDLLNRLMTFGQDTRWRRHAAALLEPNAGRRYLDIGAGTGDLALELARLAPCAQILAIDFSPEMIRAGRSRPRPSPASWLLADGTRLPFKDGTFHGAISGFFLRNVKGLERALQEQFRVLLPGGRIVILESSPPSGGLTRWLHQLHLRVTVPLLGRFIAHDAAAYRYLSESTEGFLYPREISTKLQEIGFERVDYMRLTYGVVVIHQARKPEHPPERRSATKDGSHRPCRGG